MEEEVSEEEAEEKVEEVEEEQEAAGWNITFAAFQ